MEMVLERLEVLRLAFIQSLPQGLRSSSGLHIRLRSSDPSRNSPATCSTRASALSAGSSHTQINIDLPVFESRRPVTASQRMRMAAAEGRQFVFFLTSLNVNNHVLSGVRYTLGAHGPVRINFL